MDNNWEKLLELLEGHKIWIQTHNFPDPDAIASAYGLQYFLKMHGIESQICYDGHVDKLSVTKMLDCFGIEVAFYDDLDISGEDYVVLVDGQKYNSNMTDIPGDEVACIDHHPTFKECEYMYKDVRIVGACSTIIAEYIKESKIPVEEKVASALLYGIKMDTDSINRGVDKLDIKMYEFLYEYSNSQLVARMYNDSIELSDLRAYGAAIQNVQIYDYVGVARIPFECEDALVAMVSDFILKLDIVTIAIIYAEKNGGIKFSVRSEDTDIHAGNLTDKALEGIGNGGGHFEMAGGYVPPENRLSNKVDEDYLIRDRFLGAIEMLYGRKFTR